MYVFRKSWPSDLMLLAAILLFIPGILKCFEKPFALKSASINSLVKAKVKVKTCSSDENGKINSLDEYVQAATNSVRGDEPSHHRVEDEPYNLFVDLQYPYSVRLENLDYTVRCKQDEAHRLVKSGLSRTFDRLYTKEQMVNGLFQPASGKRLVWQEARPKDMCSALVRAAAYTLTFAALRLFHPRPSEAYDATDVKITYILLSCTVALELLAVVFDSQSFRRQEHPQSSATDSTEVRRRDRPWPEQVAQYNLIGYLARNRKHTWFRMLATSLRCKDYLDQLWCMEPRDSFGDIPELVHGHVVDGWKHYINDTATYRAFNDIWGQLTLRKEGRAEVEWSLRRPFDESVLLWHLATDFCCSKMGASHDNQTSRHYRVMSNYMAYLLFINPEMLMAGTRRSLFGATYDELNKMLKEKPESVETEGELTQKIIQQVSTPALASFVSEAWKLTEALMGSSNDEEEMWIVIQGVWVEMLCFSAGRCRGYLHAKSLGKGGEYLSYVWLLLSYMGMETLAERLERTELREDGDKGAAGLTPARATTGDNNA